MSKSKVCVPKKGSPSLYLSDEYAKQFQHVDVGTSVKFAVTAKLQRKSKSEESSGSKSCNIDLTITKLVLDSSVEKKLEGKEF
jgi:hypothetical protein